MIMVTVIQIFIACILSQHLFLTSSKFDEHTGKYEFKRNLIKLFLFKIKTSLLCSSTFPVTKLLMLSLFTVSLKFMSSFYN